MSINWRDNYNPHKKITILNAITLILLVFFELLEKTETKKILALSILILTIALAGIIYACVIYNPLS